MQEKHLFEYAVIRIVPHVEREEFINVGVILYCKSLDFLGVKWSLDESFLHQFAQALDMDEVRQHLCAFDIISIGGPEGGTIGMMDTPGRFRWLTATRSTVLQISNVHPGYTQDAKQTLDRLYLQLVARN